MSEREFEGRTALVTGGAKGIGRACCQILAKGGANVCVNYLTSETAAVETVASLATFGVEAMAMQADVSKEDDVRGMVDTIGAELGPIDILVNNAGIFDYGPQEEITYESWQRTMDCNLNSAFLATWAVKDSMIERRFGRIVNIASIAAIRARSMSIAYAVSKAGMVMFTKSLSEVLAQYNIRINAVAPGLTETEIIDGVAESAKQKLIDATPIGRIGQPEEIAEAVAFLLSERSSFTTGQTLVASGGRVMIP